jgi:lipopolysaccharide biosynthesis regulator YciM
VRWWTRAFGGNARAPGDVDALLRSALLAVLERDLERAEELLSSAAKVDSEGVEPYLALARLFRMRGEIGRAIRIHQNLLLRRDLSQHHRVLSLADLAADFRQGGFLRRSIASYEEVLAYVPRHVEALRALVRLLSDVHDYDRAIEMEQRLARIEARESSSAEAELLVQKARAAQAEGRNEDARRAIKRALRRDARSAQAWLELGALEAERGRSKAALAAWQRVPGLDPRSGGLVYPRLEAAYAALGKSRDYEAFLRKQLEDRGDDRAARLALAHTLAARGQLDDAVAEVRRALEHDPDDLEARAALGRFFLSERRDPEAVKEYGELLDVLDRRGLLRSRERLL